MEQQVEKYSAAVPSRGNDGIDGAEYQLIHVSLLMRHGSRLPTPEAMTPFLDEDETVHDSANPVVAEWNGQFDSLTETGEKQVIALAEWFNLKYSESLLHGDYNIKWMSSKADRAYRSGQAFMNRLAELTAYPKKQDLQKSVPFLDSDGKEQDTDLYFKGYKVNQDYIPRVKALRDSGKAFTEKAEAEAELVAALNPIKGKAKQQESKAKSIDRITYFHEVVEVERYHMASPKDSLTKLLTAEQMERIEHIAHFCWNERFFKCDPDAVLGKPLLQVVSQHIADCIVTKSRQFLFLSGHDYSILMLLNALGVKDYPFPVLSFASYLTIQVWQDRKNEGNRFVRVLLNNTPFANRADGTAVTQVADAETEIISSMTIEEFSHKAI